MNNTVELRRYFGVYIDDFIEHTDTVDCENLPENDPRCLFSRAIEDLKNRRLLKAELQLRGAAEGGHALAAYGLGVFLVVVSDEENKEMLTEAVEWLTFAADLGCDKAMVALAFFYLADDCPFFNLERSAAWFGRGAEVGNQEAIYEYGCCYLMGRGVEQNYTKSRFWFEKGSALDDTLSQFELGVQYSLGEGVDKDLSKAVDLFKKAAEKEHPGAMASLAQFYYDGEGIEQNYSEAFRLFFKCYRAGNPKGHVGLAHFYMDNTAVSSDYQTVFYLLCSEETENFPPAQRLRAHLLESMEDEAKKGDTFASTQLGWAILNGYLLDGDKTEAFKMISLSAEKEDPLARCLLYCYFKEEDTPFAASKEESIAFFRENMDYGIAWAARELLFMIFREEYTPSEEEIEEIYTKAVELGDFSLREYIINRKEENQ